MADPRGLLRSGALGLLSALALGCDSATTPPPDAGPLGYTDASSPDLAGARPPALAPDDIAGAAQRGVVLWKMQRAMTLGLNRAGPALAERSLAERELATLVALDPGGRSGELTVFRWPAGTLDDGRRRTVDAIRWFQVSLTLDPDEAFEPQVFDDTPTSEQLVKLMAVDVARAEAEREHGGGVFSVHALREQRADGRGQTRVYLFGLDARSPDLEYTVVDPAKRKQPFEIVDARMHLGPGRADQLPLETPVVPPGAPTLARAVATATTLGEPVTVVDASGAGYLVHPNSGRTERLP